MHGRKAFVYIVPLIIMLGAASCNFGHKEYQASADTSGASSPIILQVNDYGRFWDRGVAESALETIRKVSEYDNTIVMVFIHGWHHNADSADTNLANFTNSLVKLREKLSGPEYIHAREQLNLRKDVKVLGLYVGWRGRSLPWFLDYLTFWGRKSAAETVGDGDLREFFVRLQNIYMQRNEHGKDRFMGLVSVGHSFGGQVLFKAISKEFEDDLTNTVATATKSQQGKLSAIVSGLGDVAVLLNPALEAYQFERIDRLKRQVAFNEAQTPVLLVISAKDDSARKVWFPVGRNLNLLFRPTFSDEEKDLWTTALGVYEPQQTHTLEPLGPQAPVDGPFELTPALYNNCAIIKFDFSRELTLGGAHLAPKTEPSQAYSPVVVAYTSTEIVHEHDGIFGRTFEDFLAEYVAFIEGKRICLIRGHDKL